MGFKSPLANGNNYKAFKSLFKRNAQSVPAEILKLTKKTSNIETGLPKAANYLDETLARMNKENGTDIRSLTLEIDKAFKKANPNMKREELRDILEAKGYIMFGLSGNDTGNAFGVKFDPKYAGGKRINDLGAKEEFFDRVINELGIDRTDIKMDVLNKRWKEIMFSEYKPVNNPNVRKRLIVVDFGKTPDGHEIVDGATFALYKTFKEIRDDGGLLMSDANHTTNKSVAIWKDPTKNLNILKHEMFKIDMNSPTSKKIEEYVRKYIPDYKISQNDIITSHNNIKTGKDILANFGTGKKNFYVTDVGMDSFRSKYNLPKDRTTAWDEENARFSPYLLSKLGFSDNLNEVVYKMYQAPMKRFNESFHKIIDSKTPEEARKNLEEYSDIYQGSLGEEVYGKTKRILENGGWGKQGSDVRYEINQTFSKAFREYILNGRFFKSSYGHFLPDIGQLGDWVPTDSIVLSKKTIDAIGNPKEVLVTRHPNTKRSGLIALKVIDADARGIKDLGDSMIINNKLGYRDLYFDTDGDAGPIFAIGKSTDKEFYIPQELANKTKENFAKEGGRLPKKLEKYSDFLKKEKREVENEISLDNSTNMGFKAVKGGDAVGENSTLRSVLQGLIDNNESIGGWTLKKPIAGQSVETHNQEMFDYFDYMNQASTDAVKAVDLSNQLALYKANSLSDLMKSKYFDPPTTLPPKAADKAFTNRLFQLRAPYVLASDNAVSDLNTFSDKLFGGYRKEGLPIYGYKQNVIKKRSKLQPVDQMLLAIEDNMPVFPSQLSAKEQTKIHNTRVKEMDQSIKNQGIKVASFDDPSVKDFTNYFVKTKDDLAAKIETMKSDVEAELKMSKDSEDPIEYKSIEREKRNDLFEDVKNLKKDTREAIEAEYANRMTSLNQEQRRAVSVWFLKNPKANWSNIGKKVVGGKQVDVETAYKDSYQHRLVNIITETPDVAQAYFKSGVEPVKGVAVKVSDETPPMPTDLTPSKPTNTEKYKNLKSLLEKKADVVKNATPEKPTVLVINTDGKYTQNGSLSIPKQNVIVLETGTLLKKFKDKAWTKPKVAGVKPFSTNRFKSFEEWKTFNKEHEIAHIQNDAAFKEMTLAEKENAANEIALKKLYPTLANKVTETLPDGSYWIEQNLSLGYGKWDPVAMAGYKVEHLKTPAGSWGRKIRIDGKEYTYSEAEAKFGEFLA
jgi:hypothetical protein